MKKPSVFKISFLFIVMSLGIPVEASAQDASRGDSCTLVFSGVPLGPNPYPVSPDTHGKPVIFGKEFPVPELHLLFINKETGKPITPKVVHVAYGWKWLEYPYPEHDWGAWSDAQDSVECSTGGDNQLVIPAHTVKPVGWYDGKYTRFPYTLTGSKKPRFDGVVIVVEFDDCRPRLAISLRELDRYKDTRAILHLPCQWPVEVEFEKRPNHADPVSSGRTEP